MALFLFDVGDELPGQLDVLLIHLYLVVYLEEVEILAESDEADLLAGESYANLSLLFAQFGELDACIDGTTGIDNLLCLKSKVVAEKSRSVRRALPM